MHPNQHNMFHTPIWGFMIRGEELHSVDYIDYILEMKDNTPSEKKSNFGGWHSPDDLHTHGIFQEFCDNIISQVNEVSSTYTRAALKFLNMWAVVNDKYCYNANHVHNGLISGVFYLKVPENSGNLILKDPAVRAHNHPIRNKDFSVKPEELSLILFPSWLEHYVEPNKSDEQRIAISFNIGEKI